MSPPRFARLWIATPGDETHSVGYLRPFEVETPWWQDIGPVVRAARDKFGVDLTVLRLLSVEEERHGGAVDYLVELDGRLGDRLLVPARRDLPDDPLRHRWARPGGPSADVQWASDRLGGLRKAEQIRTWNLSSIWRLVATNGRIAWLKVVPPFFAHEAAVIVALSGGRLPVPSLIARDAGRMLLDDIPGVDGYDASPGQQADLARAVVDIQHYAATKVDELLAAGVPDWRATEFASLAEQVAARRASQLTNTEQVSLGRLIEQATTRLAVSSESGIPDTLVHGDVHPGNARWAPDGTLTMLDWGDSTIGCPLLDLANDTMSAQRTEWLDAWSTGLGVDRAEIARAWDAIRPLAILKSAIVYQRFLDNIEVSEHVYHRHDVLPYLRHAANDYATKPRAGR